MARESRYETPHEYTHRFSAHSSDPVPPGARQSGPKLLGSRAEHLELRPISWICYGTRCRYRRCPLRCLWPLWRGEADRDKRACDDDHQVYGWFVSDMDRDADV